MTNPVARSYLMSRFNDWYNDLPAAKFNNAAEFNNFISGLKNKKISYTTKIIKKKPRGRIFIVMRLETMYDG